ncbi:MAG: response regulator [Gaiellaceae bacterium]
MPLVLIVDDSAEFRASARLLLEGEGYEVAEADRGESGVQRARKLAPNLVLLDIRLPDFDGFEVAERLSRLDSPPAVILTSTVNGHDFDPLIADSPVRGFVPKGELSGPAIRALVSRA